MTAAADRFGLGGLGALVETTARGVVGGRRAVLWLAAGVAIAAFAWTLDGGSPEETSLIRGAVHLGATTLVAGAAALLAPILLAGRAHERPLQPLVAVRPLSPAVRALGPALGAAAAAAGVAAGLLVLLPATGARLGGKIRTRESDWTRQVAQKPETAIFRGSVEDGMEEGHVLRLTPLVGHALGYGDPETALWSADFVGVSSGGERETQAFELRARCRVLLEWPGPDAFEVWLSSGEGSTLAVRWPAGSVSELSAPLSMAALCIAVWLRMLPLLFALSLAGSAIAALLDRAIAIPFAATLLAVAVAGPFEGPRAWIGLDRAFDLQGWLARELPPLGRGLGSVVLFGLEATVVAAIARCRWR